MLIVFYTWFIVSVHLIAVRLAVGKKDIDYIWANITELVLIVPIVGRVFHWW